MAEYVVNSGDTLIDVCYNTTGSLAGIDAIMDMNQLDTYTPELTPGQVLQVPEVVYNSEAAAVASERPYNSSNDRVNLMPELMLLASTFMQGGSIKYLLKHDAVSGKELVFNIEGIKGLYVNFGDGTHQYYPKIASGKVIHTYGPMTTNPVVTMAGEIDGFVNNTTEDTAAFRASPLSIDARDIEHMCTTITLGFQYFDTDFTFLCNSVPKNVLQLRLFLASGKHHPDDKSDIRGIFSGCSDASNAGACFSMATGIPSLDRVFEGCYSLTSISGAFSGVTGCPIPTNILDDCPNITNFNAAFSTCVHPQNGESPFTLVNGVKVKLWMRGPEYGFETPTIFSGCFGGSNFTDIDQIPAAWGGKKA